MLALLYYSLVITVSGKQITTGGKQLQSTTEKIFRISETELQN